MSRTAFDAAHGILTLTAQLRNSSAAALRGPFVLRIGSLPSELATSAIAMSDNGTGGAGAEWGFADAVLEPGASSQPRRLRFTVAEIRPFRDDHHYRLGLLDLSATVSTLERRP